MWSLVFVCDESTNWSQYSTTLRIAPFNVTVFPVHLRPARSTACWGPLVKSCNLAFSGESLGNSKWKWDLGYDLEAIVHGKEENTIKAAFC